MKQIALFLFCLCTFGGTMQAQMACADPPAGMTNWWTADTKVRDYIGTGHATARDGAGFGVGMVGQAFTFPGGLSRVDMPASSFVQPTDKATVDAWIYPTAHGNHGIYGLTVFSNTGTHGLAMRVYRGKLQADFRTPIGGTDPTTVLSGPVLALNAWSHVAITYDGTAARSYVNGKLVGTRAQRGPIRDTDNAGTCPVIGNENTGCVNQNIGYAFKGSIDEVGVFDRALDASEILAIYEAGAAGKCRDRTRRE